MQVVAFTAVTADHLLGGSMDGAIYESGNGGKSFTTVHQLLNLARHPPPATSPRRPRTAVSTRSCEA
jgi:hypothetical protein